LERSIRVKIRHESINHTVRSPLETALDDSRLDKQGETRQYQPIVAAHEHSRSNTNRALRWLQECAKVPTQHGHALLYSLRPSQDEAGAIKDHKELLVPSRHLQRIPDWGWFGNEVIGQR